MYGVTKPLVASLSMSDVIHTVTTLSTITRYAFHLCLPIDFEMAKLLF